MRAGGLQNWDAASTKRAGEQGFGMLQRDHEGPTPQRQMSKKGIDLAKGPRETGNSVRRGRRLWSLSPWYPISKFQNQRMLHSLIV
ncbi:IAA-amino acid hydrolase ILR1-like 9 [Fusarium oxysporum f. sp. albedinis]|nr:putative lipid transporter atnI [Fusarium oxysporum f. sp. albedinis]KAJ0135858.1 IAA-amino acid hydrolase ILR1-like 9 [Fusarium oxysporum f. sp. albedinis]